MVSTCSLNPLLRPLYRGSASLAVCSRYLATCKVPLAFRTGGAGLLLHWQSWMMTFWGDYLGLSHLTSDNGFILVDFPFVFCLVLIAIASRFAKSSDPEVPLSRKFYSLLAGAGLLAAWYALMIYLAGRGISLDITLYFVVDWFVAFLMVSHWPYRQALLSASATTILLMLLLVAGNGLWEATTAGTCGRSRPL